MVTCSSLNRRSKPNELWRILMAYDFSSARFDQALDLSPHINALFNKNRNVGHKRAGATNFYLRGSHSKAGLKSLPVSLLIVDEFDAMMQENVALAEERMSGQVQKQSWFMSTPTLPGFGINKKFEESSQEFFHFPCPCCGKVIYLELECFVLNEDEPYKSYTACPECKKPLPSNHPSEVNAKIEMLSKGFMVKHNSKHDPETRGFRVNQLYSCTVSPAEFARAVLLARDDPYYKQELYNSKLGLPYIHHDAKVSLEMVNKALGDYQQVLSVPFPDKIRTLGIDVGTFLHWVVKEWDIPSIGLDINTHAKARILAVGKCTDFKDLDDLFPRYQIHGCVIDMNPERRKAKEFADRHRGFVRLCYYGKGQQGRSINVKANEGSAITDDYQVTVDRTAWIDAAIGRYIRGCGAITIPRGLPQEFIDQITNVVKIYAKDSNGNPVSKYVVAEEKKNDHYAHASTYAEIALPLAVARTMNVDIKGIL